MSLLKRSQHVLKSVQSRVFASTNRLVKTVEQVVGIEEVRLAQDNVLKFESSFVNAQTNRRGKQQELSDLQNKLKSVQNQLSKLSRSDDRYLDLVTAEHGLLRQETSLRTELDGLEQAERSEFSQLSTALRYSHERERVHGERTKYFSVVGSVAGALLGAVATGLSGYLRVRELHTAVDASANQCIQLQDMVGRLEKEVSQSSDKNAKFLEEFRQLVGINSAAILLAGVGDDKPPQNSTKQNKQNQNDISFVSQFSGNSPELLDFMAHSHLKLDSIESLVSKLSPVTQEQAQQGGGLVVRCEHPVLPDSSSSNLPIETVVDDVNSHIDGRLKSYTVTLGSLAFVSGVALTLSLIFALR